MISFLLDMRGRTQHGFRPYIEMIGGEFDGHPWSELVTVRNEQTSNAVAAPFEARFEITDEIYQFKTFSREDKQVLLSLDKSNDSRAKKKTKEGVEQTFFERGKRSDGDYAVSWIKPFGEGRVFYTSLGHRDEVWNQAEYQQHLLKGIQWALKMER